MGNEMLAEGWTARSLGGAEPLTRRLSQAEINSIAAKAQLSAGKSIEAIDRSDFSDPVIAALMDEVSARINHGPGAVVLSGLDISQFDANSFERTVVGLASHLGSLAPQSNKRDRLGYVRKVADNPSARGYQSDIELRAHTDFHEVLGLACVSLAADGGLSGLTSLAAVYNILAQENPDVLSALAEGFPHDTTGDGLLSDGPIPVLTKKNNMVFGYHQRLFMITAAQTLGREIPQRLLHAMESFEAVANRDDVMLSFLLRPGEIVLWHNFRVLHSRTNFRNSAEHNRLLLRVWLNPDEHLPVPPVYLSQARRFDALHEQGIPAIVYTKTGVRV